MKSILKFLILDILKMSNFENPRKLFQEFCKN